MRNCLAKSRLIYLIRIRIYQSISLSLWERETFFNLNHNVCRVRANDHYSGEGCLPHSYLGSRKIERKRNLGFLIIPMSREPMVG